MRVRILLAIGLLTMGTLAAQAPPSPSLQVNFGQEGGNFSIPIQILVILSLLTFLPAMLVSVTSFTRILIVTHFLRQALGTQSAPNNQVLIGLSLFNTLIAHQ